MPRKKYTSEFKTKIVLSILQDNIMIERWFRSLKTEQLYPNEYRTPRELRRLINQYVDDYNNIRPHEALGYKVPNEFYFACFAA